jgi:hypothetical protein
LANWFEYLYKDRNLLREYYDLKQISTGSSNDSGVGGIEGYLYPSTPSSINSSATFSITANNSNSNTILLKNNNPNNVDDSFINSKYDNTNLIASLSLASLNNVSIFENEEYFNYFHKLVQQFNYIDLNLKILNDQTFLVRQSFLQPATQQSNVHNQSNPQNQQPQLIDESDKQEQSKINKPMAPKRKISVRGTSNANVSLNQAQVDSDAPKNQIKNTRSPSLIPTTNTKSQANNLAVNISSKSNSSISANNANSSNTHAGFNFKTISKKLNLKSWFSSSSNHSNSQNASANNKNPHQHQQQQNQHHNLPNLGAISNQYTNISSLNPSNLPRNSSNINTNSSNTNGVSNIIKGLAPSFTQYLSTQANKSHTSKKDIRNHTIIQRNPEINFNLNIDNNNETNFSNFNDNNLMKHSLSEPTLNRIID